MRKVSNKKIIRTLAIKVLRAGKKKNIAIITAILLTTVMFTTLFSVAMSMLETTRNATMRQVGGSSMAGLKYARICDYEKLKSDPKVKKISYRVLVGILNMGNVKDSTTELYYSMKENAEQCFSLPSVGRLPEKYNEVALSSITLQQLGVKEKLGETVHLKIQIGEKVVEDDFVLSGYWTGDPVAMAQMGYVSEQYQQQNAKEPKESYYDTNATGVEGYCSIDFDFATSFNIEKQTIQLLQRNNYDANMYDYGINWAYETATVDVTTVLLMITILAVILIAGYLIIYNIFYISVVSDIHQYGLLKTIGTSGKQLKSLVRIQALTLSAIGIPLGLMVGTVTARIVFPLILKNTDIAMDNMVISIHPLIYVSAAVFALVTVRMGCRKPEKYAGKVSPVEAVKYQPVSSSKRKQKNTRKISILRLALENVSRDKKRVFVVVLSLTLAILLVNGIYSVVLGLDPDKYVSQSIIGDINVSNAGWNRSDVLVNEKTVVNGDAMEYLKNITGVKEVSNVYCDMSAQKFIHQREKEVIRKYIEGSQDSRMAEDGREQLKYSSIDYDYYGIDTVVLENITLNKGKIDLEKWNSGSYAIGYSYQLIDRSQKDETMPLFDVGDKVTVTLQNGKEKTYTIMALGQMPYALSTKAYYSMGGQLMVPQEEYLSMEGNTGALVSIINARKGMLDTVLQQVTSYVDNSDTLTCVSKQTYLKEFDDFIRSIKIVGGALAAVLAVIGIMNFTNSILTGIWRRARELAVMQAIGLTRRQMTNMLILEGMYYGVLSIVLSVAIHTVVGTSVINMLAGEMWFFKSHFTILPILLCMPFVMLVSVSIPLIASRKMKKESIVNRMRME